MNMDYELGGIWKEGLAQLKVLTYHLLGGNWKNCSQPGSSQDSNWIPLKCESYVLSLSYLN